MHISCKRLAGARLHTYLFVAAREGMCALTLPTSSMSAKHDAKRPIALTAYDFQKTGSNIERVYLEGPFCSQIERSNLIILR